MYIAGISILRKNISPVQVFSFKDSYGNEARIALEVFMNQLL